MPIRANNWRVASQVRAKRPKINSASERIVDHKCPVDLEPPLSTLSARDPSVIAGPIGQGRLAPKFEKRQILSAPKA